MKKNRNAEDKPSRENSVSVSDLLIVLRETKNRNYSLLDGQAYFKERAHVSGYTPNLKIRPICRVAPVSSNLQ